MPTPRPPPFFVKTVSQEGRRWREGGSERASLALAGQLASCVLTRPALRRRSVGRITGPRTALGARRSRVRGSRLPTPHPVAAFASRWRLGGFPLWRLRQVAPSRAPGGQVDVQGRLRRLVGEGGCCCAIAGPTIAQRSAGLLPETCAGATQRARVLPARRAFDFLASPRPPLAESPRESAGATKGRSRSASVAVPLMRAKHQSEARPGRPFRMRS